MGKVADEIRIENENKEYLSMNTKRYYRTDVRGRVYAGMPKA